MSMTYFLLFLSAAMLAAEAATMPEGLRRILASVNSEDKPSMAEIEEARRNYEDGEFSQYMPTPMQEEAQEAQCYIEYQVTKHRPGRCIKLGGHTPACQSNEYISINYNSCS